MSSKDVEQIKERLPIADVISSYIKLDHAGANYKGRCPFHNEKTPSFMVSPARNSYYCFGCSAKGDIFTFVQEFEKVDFKESLKILADRAGIVLDTYRAPEDKSEEDEKDRLRKIMEVAASFFETELSKDEVSLKYLSDRGLEEKTIKEWRLGSTRKGWGNLHEHLKEKGCSDEDIEKAGLAKKGNHGFYDRFRSRIMFPIFDPAGKVIAFTGRFKDWEAEEGKDAETGAVIQAAKYLNSPDTILFDKSRTLYGYHKAKLSIPKWKFSLLVEGQMDLLMCQQAGYSNAVATSGTALTKSQLEMLARFSKNLLIVYDGDKAGIEAARRAWSLALSIGMDVKIASLPAGSDPADLIVANPAGFKESVRKGVHLIGFYLRALLGRGLEGRELGKEVERELLPYVKAIESPIDQAHFISLISSRTGIKEDALHAALAKVAKAGETESPASTLLREENNDTMLAQQHSLKPRLIAGTYLLLNQEEKAQAFVPNAADIKDELVFVVEEWLAKSGQTSEEYLADLLRSTDKEKLQSDLKEVMKRYLEAEEKGDSDQARELLKKSDEIRKGLAQFN
jgi:DNA primase